MSSNSEEHAAQSATRDAPGANGTPRRVLGDVSPNVRHATHPGLPGSKPMAGSPLKRTSTAMDEEKGLLYFKKRKLSAATPLSQVSTPTDENGGRDVGVGRSVTRTPEVVERTSVPTIQHDGPTEPNTPAVSPKQEEQETSSAERKSFSSLINYDPSSQTVPTTDQSSGYLSPGSSRAELLKLRLQVAMFKIRTNQVDVPFSDLQVPSSASPTPTATEPEPTIDLISDWKRRIFAKAPAPASAPVYVPAPILRPTPYSSRMIRERQIPSSPPQANASSERLPQGLPPTTPGNSRAQRVDEQELTSSIVKGRVAEGLLGLRNAV